MEAAEADTDVEDELLPILKRTMSKGLNAEAVVVSGQKQLEEVRFILVRVSVVSF